MFGFGEDSGENIATTNNTQHRQFYIIRDASFAFIGNYYFYFLKGVTVGGVQIATFFNIKFSITTLSVGPKLVFFSYLLLHITTLFSEKPKSRKYNKN